MKRVVLFYVLIVFFSHSHAQWKATTGPVMSSDNLGMSFSHLVVNGDMLYALINNMVYISYNNGESWMYASGIDPINAFRMACSGNTIYAGTSGSGIFKSENFGSTYQAINNNLPKNAMVSAMFANDNVLIAAVNSDYPIMEREVYLSTDKGANWTATTDLSEKFIKCFTSDGPNLYAGANDGVFKSEDNGKSWKNIGLQNTSGIYSLTVKNNKIIAAEAISNGNIYLSSDNGSTWKTISTSLPTHSFSSVALTDNYLYVSSNWDGAFRSDNDGASWTKILNGGGSQIVYLILPNGNNLYAGLQQGFAISTDNGLTWKKDYNTFNDQIRSVVSVGSNLLATTSQGICSSKDEGATWDRNYIDMKVFETVDSMLYVGGENGLYRSFDLGNNLDWQDIQGLPAHPGFTDIAAIGSMVFASLYDHGVYFSNDYASLWIALNNGLTNYKLTALVLDDSTLYAASETNGMFRSRDLGENWNPVNTGLMDMNVNCLENFQNNLYAGTNNKGIFKSVDHGNTWIHLQNEISNSKVVCMYSYGSNLFAGVEGKGLYLSPDNGQNWVACNTGLLDYNVNSITENDKDLYLGTKGGAVWKRALNELPLSLSVKNISATERVVCKGSTSVLTGHAIGGQPPYSYRWNDGSKSSTLTITPSETTTYTLTVTDASSNTASYDLKIWVNNKPETPVITMSGDTLISNYTSGNIWMKDGEVIEYETSQKFIPYFKKGNYSLKVIKDGCMSEISNIVILDNHIIPGEEAIKIFPNPAQDILHIEIEGQLGNVVFSMINLMGETTLQQTITSHSTPINVENLHKGIYVAQLKMDGITSVKKIVIE